MEIAIIMGSISDMPVVRKAYDLLTQLNIPTEMKILSAHRTPDELKDFVKQSDAKVFIAAAGGAAHLAGAIASHTVKPVIGVPIETILGGIDSLLATVQMPKGIPVATVAINGAENAAILAMQMLAISDEEIRTKVIDLRIEQKRKVLDSDSDQARQSS